MQQETLIPGPELMESMRAVGYTLATSVADIVDNSIAAHASNVWIDFSATGHPQIAITDDGAGMTSVESLNAMRLAGNSPLADRNSDDLGRFGLGLKTASLAQCRKLTLISKKNNTVTALRWDLDHLAATGVWAVLRLTASEIEELPLVRRLDRLSSGTVVLWQDLDQLTATIGTEQHALDGEMRLVKDHLSLVFHRFIAEKSSPSLSLRLNEVLLPSIDPFLRDHRGTQKGPHERIFVEGQAIEIQPYTLPYMNKLTKADSERAMLTGALRESQGFYVYRANRLVVWGTWFRLVPRAQMNKLARVQVDIPNSLDHLWALDIKKSAAAPPPSVRLALKRFTERIVEPSRRTQKYRGRGDEKSNDETHVWRVIVDRDTYRYEINRRHPIVMALQDTVGDINFSAVEALLRATESTFPVQDVHNRLSEDESPAQQTREQNIDQAVALWHIYKDLGNSIDDFIDAFSLVEPFSTFNDFESVCRKEFA